MWFPTAMDDAFKEDTLRRKAIRENEDKIRKVEAFLEDKGITEGERESAKRRLKKLEIIKSKL